LQRPRRPARRRQYRRALRQEGIARNLYYRAVSTGRRFLPASRYGDRVSRVAQLDPLSLNSPSVLGANAMPCYRLGTHAALRQNSRRGPHRPDGWRQIAITQLPPVRKWCSAEHHCRRSRGSKSASEVTGTILLRIDRSTLRPSAWRQCPAWLDCNASVPTVPWLVCVMKRHPGRGE
jgi:hypothetical protein